METLQKRYPDIRDRLQHKINYDPTIIDLRDYYVVRKVLQRVHRIIKEGT